MHSLPKLVFSAAEREAQRDVMPLWLAHYLLQSLIGKKPIQFDEFINSIKPGAEPPENPRKTAEEIIAAAMPFIEADRKRTKQKS